MLFVTLFYIIWILCSEQIILEEDVFRVVYDRRIFKYRCVNLSNQKKVHLRNDFLLVSDNNTFLCDRFFPNPFIYEFRFAELKKFTIENAFVISCLTENKDLLFEFKIKLDFINIKISNFYDAEKVNLSLRKFKNNKYDVYILSSQEKHFESLKNSMNYSEKIESFNLFHSKILVLQDFCIDRKFDSILDKINNSNQFDASFLTDIVEFKRAKIISINICFLIYSLIFIPGLPKAEFCKHFEYYGKRLTEIFESLLYFMEFSKNGILNINMPDEILKTELMKTLDDAIIILKYKLEKLEQNNVFMPHFGLKNKIEELDLFLDNVLESGNMNTQVILDCNTSIIDKFVDLYILILTEYCEILDRSEVVSLYAHYFLENNVIQTNYANPLAIYRDIFISKKSKQYLERYQNDKTDFLIFSETSYFKFELASNVDKVVKDLLMAFDLREKQNTTIFGPTGELLKESMEFKQKILDFKTNWYNCLICFGKLDTLSFDDVLKKLYNEEITCIDKKSESPKEKLFSDDKITDEIEENEQIYQFYYVDPPDTEKFEDVSLTDELDQKVILESKPIENIYFDDITIKRSSDDNNQESIGYLETETLNGKRKDQKDDYFEDRSNGEEDKLIKILKEEQLNDKNVDFDKDKKELLSVDKGFTDSKKDYVTDLEDMIRDIKNDKAKIFIDEKQSLDDILDASHNKLKDLDVKIETDFTHDEEKHLDDVRINENVDYNEEENSENIYDKINEEKNLIDEEINFDETKQIDIENLIHNKSFDFKKKDARNNKKEEFNDDQTNLLIDKKVKFENDKEKNLLDFKVNDFNNFKKDNSLNCDKNDENMTDIYKKKMLKKNLTRKNTFILQVVFY